MVPYQNVRREFMKTSHTLQKSSTKKQKPLRINQRQAKAAFRKYIEEEGFEPESTPNGVFYDPKTDIVYKEMNFII
jgi:hypothetical protein